METGPKAPRLRTFLLKGFYACGVLLYFGYFLLLACANYESVFFGPLTPGDVLPRPTSQNALLALFERPIYFADGDCYTRMHRAKLVDRDFGLILRKHDFENYPQGTVPHTTAPMDYAIVLLKRLFSLFGLPQPLDLAGAFISPLLGLLTTVYLWWWTGKRFRGAARWMPLTAWLFSPTILWAFGLGRPDHQGLLMLCLCVATTLFYDLIEAQGRETFSKADLGSAAVAGAFLGISVWVSLYEPLFFVAAFCAAFFLIVKGKWNCLTRMHLLGFAGVSLVALGVEHPRILDSTSGLFSGAGKQWLSTIGELARVGPSGWSRYFGWLVWISPLVLWAGWRQGLVPPPYYRFFSGLLVFLFVLALWQPRWMPYFAMVYVLTIPLYLGIMKGRIWKWGLFLPLLIPCILYLSPRNVGREPDDESNTWQQANLRYLCCVIPHDKGMGVMGPWWFSPMVLYWTGNPIVAGTSHQSLPGIEDSAKFFSTMEPAEATDLLKKRRVKVVIGYDAPRLVSNSISVLGLGEVNDRTILQTEGYPYSTGSRLMDETQEDWSALGGRLTTAAYSSPLEKYKFKIFWVLESE